MVWAPLSEWKRAVAADLTSLARTQLDWIAAQLLIGKR